MSRPRQTDVAAAAGVSPAVVSLVLRGRLDGNVRISHATQQRVHEAIRSLGYVANPVARKLAGGATRLLGVFTYEPLFPAEQQNFYHPFLVGIEEAAEIEDYDLLLFTRGGTRSAYREGVNRLQLADGAVLFGAAADRNELARLRDEHFPFVFIGRRRVPGEGEIAYVGADYRAATAEVVRHLIALGHRRIMYLRKDMVAHTEAAEDRESGFVLGHQRLGVPLLSDAIVRLPIRNITPELLRRQRRQGVTAVIAQDTETAIHVLEVAGRLQLKVPRDLSLAVLGDPVDLVESSLLDVTTFTIPRREMGAAAVQLLVRLLADPHDSGSQQVLMPCQFVPGATTAPPPEPKHA